MTARLEIDPRVGEPPQRPDAHLHASLRLRDQLLPMKRSLRRVLVNVVTHPRVVAVVRLLGRSIPREVLHFDVLIVTELRVPTLPGRQRRGFRARPATRDDLPRLAGLFPTDSRTMEERLTAGEAVFVGEIDGNCVAMAWLSMKGDRDEPHKFCRFLLPADAAWSHDVAVLPRWRLSGALPGLLAHTFEVVLQGGRQRLCGYASSYNQASLRAHYSLGHRPIATVTVLNLLGLRLHRIRHHSGAGRRKTHVSFRQSPTIDLAHDTVLHRDRGTP